MIRLRPYASSDQFVHRRLCSKALRDGLNAFNIFASCPYTALKNLRLIRRTCVNAPRWVPRSVIDNPKTAHDICTPRFNVAFFALPKTQWTQGIPLCVDAHELQIRFVHVCPLRLHIMYAHGNGHVMPTGHPRMKAMDAKSLE